MLPIKEKQHIYALGPGQIGSARMLLLLRVSFGRSLGLALEPGLPLTQPDIGLASLPLHEKCTLGRLQQGRGVLGERLS